MPLYTDQLNRSVGITSQPKRIVSVVPSQTELLYDLNLSDRVVGITNFCIHPQEWHRSKIRIGGTKKLKIELIRELNPDLIIANKEENTKEEIELLCKEFPVWISDITTLNEALDMIAAIGEITATKKRATELITQIDNSFSSLKKDTVPKETNSLYLIWRKPFMTVGTDTIIHDMLSYCGLKNLIKETRYPVIDTEEIKRLNPDLILLSSEPYPFKQKHIDELQSICPNAKILLCDGEYFSWYGSRLLGAAHYFRSLQKRINNE